MGTNGAIYKIYHRQSGRESSARRLHGRSEKFALPWTASAGRRPYEFGARPRGRRCGKIAIFETGLMRKVEVHGR
jgi:hypothetical protein